MIEVEKIHHILLAFGGNLPFGADAPDVTVVSAVAALVARGFDLVAMSALYRSPAVTLDEGGIAPEYINAVAALCCRFSAAEVLLHTQAVERQFGRAPGTRWSARTLDIDLLAHDDNVLPSDAQWHLVVGSNDPAAILKEPVVPHPRLHLRGFVLAPLLDIAPAWRHPVLGDDVRGLAERASASGTFDGVEKIVPGGGKGVK